VVRRLIYRLGRRRILLPSHQWFCWLPVRRGRHTVIALGAPSPIRISHLAKWSQLLRISCLAAFGASFFIAIATFKGYVGFSNSKPTALWIVYILWPLACTVIYVVSQLILVFRTLEDRWPIGDIIFGTAFFTIAQVLLFAFSATICDAIKHYIDGLFFFTLCMLLSVMMVYKYWDSITVRQSAFMSRIRSHLVRDKLARGSRILRRLQSHCMGGEGPAFGGARIGLVWGGHSKQLPWGTRQPRRWYQWTAAIPAEGI
jgi:hypothetical protein